VTFEALHARAQQQPGGAPAASSVN
jgi:hypothetical protein